MFFDRPKLSTSFLFPLGRSSKRYSPPLYSVGFRKFLGYNQDLSHPQYKLLIEALLETFEGHSNIIYAAGHEHNLQYVEKDSIHHIVSGSAGMSSYVARSKKTDYAQQQKGFARLDFYDNGDVWLDFITTSEDMAFRKKLFNKPVYNEQLIDQSLREIDYSDSTIVTYPNGEKYQAGYFSGTITGTNGSFRWKCLFLILRMRRAVWKS